MSKQHFLTLNTDILKYQYAKVRLFIEEYTKSTEINDLIDVYLVLKLLKKEKSFAEYKYLIREFSKDLSENFPESIYMIDYDSINATYKNVFWELALYLEKINKDDKEKFEIFIDKYNISVINLEERASLINLFPDIIKNNFLSQPKNIEFFLNHQSGEYTDSENGLYKKLKLTNGDINRLAEQYCKGDLVNPNYLQSIVDYKKKSQYSFEDKIKLLSKRKKEEIVNRHFETNEGFRFFRKVEISPLETDEIYSLDYKGIDFSMTINSNILDEHLDYPTLLNNFIYVFGFFNYETGLPWLVAHDETFSLSKQFSYKSNADYDSFNYELKDLVGVLFRVYFYYLREKGIDIEQIIAWYFSDYLEKELNIKGFYFNASNKESSFYERGKCIISEMDSILSQYELFFKNEEIDKDLLEFKSQTPSYRNLRSFNAHKFIKLRTNADNDRLFSLLFSDQSNLSYLSLQEDITTFYKHVKTGIKMSDFDEEQKYYIKQLIENNIVELSNNAIQFINVQEIDILYELWKSGTYCLFYRNELELKSIENLVKNKFCDYTGTLFSESEMNYLSYILDDKQYGNGLKIRNKFVHGNFAITEKEYHLKNYLELLQIVIFYVIRINDELECYTQLRESKE